MTAFTEASPAEPNAEPQAVAASEATAPEASAPELAEEAGPAAEAEIVAEAEVLEAPEASSEVAPAEEPEARDVLPEEESIVEVADEAALLAGEVSAITGNSDVTEQAPAAFNNSGESA